MLERLADQVYSFLWVLIALHVLAVVYWIYKVATERPVHERAFREEAKRND